MSHDEFLPYSSALRRAFIACVLCLTLFQFSENTTDVDLWGHIVFGQDFLQTGKWEVAEPYSWTATGHVWINHEIIAEVALALAHLLLGGAGLLLLKTLVGILTFWIALSASKPIEREAVHSKGIMPVAWAFGALAVVEISFGFAARPQIFTALALAIQFWLLKQIHAGHRRWALVLPLLFAVWINTHGGALAGIILLLVTAVATTAQEFGSRLIPESLRARLGFRTSPGTARSLWLFFTASAIALFANPYGYELIRWLAKSVIWLRPEIAEWNPVPFNGDHAAFFSCVTITAASFLFSRRPIALWELLCTVALAVMGFRSTRHTPLFCIAALVFVPAHLADAMERYKSSFARLAEIGRRASTQKTLTALFALTSLGIIYATLTLHKERAWTMEVPRQQYPVAALDFIKQHELRGNLLVFFDWGEQCIWELSDSRVSIDGRLDTCYPRNVIAAHWKIYNGEPFDESAVPLEHADLALLPSNLAGSLALTRQRGWQAAYVDDTAVVLVRDTKQFPKLAGLSLPVAGTAKNTKGRAAFPDRPSLRIINPKQAMSPTAPQL